MSEAGKMLDDIRFDTTEENLRREVSALKAREVLLTIESAPMARWAAGILRPLVKNLIVCDPRENRLVARSAAKCDELDVKSLCRLLRMDELSAIWMSENEERQIFREAVWDLLKLRDQQRELKGQIKNRYLALGVLRLNGREVFHPDKRQRWIEQVPSLHRRGLLGTYELFDTALGLWTEQLLEVRRLAKSYPEIERFQEMPGIGEIGASVFCAIVEDPNRFATCQKLSRYCALGITKRTSDGKPLGYERLERRGQRELKNVSYHAWRTGIRAGKQSDVIRRFYFASKERTGTARHGRLNTQRKILKTLWLMWKNQTHFSPDLFLQTPEPEPERRPRRRRRRSRRTRSQKG